MTDFDPFLHGQRKAASKQHEKSAQNQDQFIKERRVQLEREKARLDRLREMKNRANQPKLVPAYESAKQVVNDPEPLSEETLLEGKAVEPERQHIDVQVW